MGSVEVGCDGGWLPHPEEQLFLDQLFAFMDRHGSPIHKVPNLGFKKSESSTPPLLLPRSTERSFSFFPFLHPSFMTFYSFLLSFIPPCLPSFLLLSPLPSYLPPCLSLIPFFFHSFLTSFLPSFQRQTCSDCVLNKVLWC